MQNRNFCLSNAQKQREHASIIVKLPQQRLFLKLENLWLSVNLSHKHMRVNHFFPASSKNSLSLCVCSFIIKCYLICYTDEDVDPLALVLSVWILIASVRILDKTVTEYVWSRFNLLSLLCSRSSCSRLRWCTWSGRTDRVECVSVEVLYIQGS